MSSEAVGDTVSPLVLSLDVGSSSVRASLYNGLGFPVKDFESGISYQLSTTPDGGVEKDPDELVKLVTLVINRVLNSCGTYAGLIKAVAMDTFWHGERSPGWASGARATITGLSLNTGPLDILRAGLEAIAYRIVLIYELIKPVTNPDSEVIASGKALLNSPTWMQIVADVLNRSVIASNEGETSSRGTALLALEQLGGFGEGKGLEYASYAFKQVYLPDSTRNARYKEGLAAQRELYELLVKSRV